MCILVSLITRNGSHSIKIYAPLAARCLWAARCMLLKRGRNRAKPRDTHKRRDGCKGLKGLRPSTCAVEATQDLDRVANQSVRNDERRPRDDKFARSRNSTGSPHFGTVGQQGFNAVEDMERNTLGGCRIILLDMSPQRREVGNRLRRPDWRHERLGTGFSFALPQDATQSLTTCCGTPSPRSSEAIARRMPPTCHSLTSRYSWMASAARKERLRPVLLANRSSRFLTPVSTLTVNVVERMLFPCS